MRYQTSNLLRIDIHAIKTGHTNTKIHSWTHTRTPKWYRDIHVHPNKICVCCTWISPRISLTHLAARLGVSTTLSLSSSSSLLPRRGSQRNLSYIRWHTLLSRCILYHSYLIRFSFSEMHTHNFFTLLQRECFCLFWLCRIPLFELGLFNLFVFFCYCCCFFLFLTSDLIIVIKCNTLQLWEVLLAAMICIGWCSAVLDINDTK